MAYKYNRYSEVIDWFALQKKINEKYTGGRGHFFPRKAIVTAFLGENVGFEKNKVRPAIVVSVDSNNQTSGNVAIVPLTKEENKIDRTTGKPVSKRLLASQYKLFKSKYGKLNHNSIVQCEDVRIVSKARIGDVIDFIDDADMKQISKRLKYFFGI
ncbi:type II toxin-antitoxin system PemK/MazF family toxin [Saccharibacillus sp. CPCC 101409]|uniref:type II toxin-antitoxin system PemK/MazF family toxin n=1 Tax=Saccharibacillus sp. CPCC 101409 TaxID=3058041 RepID=UPI00267135D9|nr:type II toxin-antitoxin system PemK/MazF family toxin [Saccharibacillus sp. CPCC 101409]MDO3409895.1 type II toxin-antitoxin system PemK/MazF family toxin [Saccharibacillus sp. CPCC 101409]